MEENEQNIWDECIIGLKAKKEDDSPLRRALYETVEGQE